MSIAELKDLLKQLKLNIQTTLELSKSLYTIPVKTLWIKALASRAVDQKRLFTENNDLIRKLSEFLTKPELSPEEVDVLRDAVYDFYYDDCDEYEVLIPIVDKIAPYYREREDYSSVVQLSYIAFYENLEVCSRYTYPFDLENVKKWCREMLSMEPHYTEIEDAPTRKRFHLNYNNITSSLAENGIIPFKDTYKYMMQYYTFSHRPEVLALDSTNPAFRDVYDRTLLEWLGSCYSGFPELSEEGQAFFRTKLQECVDRHFDNGGLEETVSDSLIGPIVYLKVIDGDITAAEAPIYYANQLLKHIAYNEVHKRPNVTNKSLQLSNEDLDFFYSFLFCIQNISELIRCFNLNPDDYQEIIVKVLRKIKEYWEDFYKVFPEAYLDKIICEDGFFLLSGISNLWIQQEIFDLFVSKRDVSTYLHCNMVSAITETIAESILKDKPSLFEGMLGHHGEEVAEHAKEYLTFLKNASKYHDVGKFGLSAIVNIQTRKLQDGEFRMITRHPGEGRNLADKLPFLAPYQDIIAGHHKSYDGKFGYPADFDNTASPIRTFIDLITLADCMDAATDYLGRNYHTAKTIEQLIEEFQSQKGTRYNPDLVDFLASNEPLKQKLSDLVREGRVDISYRVYDEQIDFIET